MNRCRPPPSATTFFVMPGYRDSRSFNTSPKVDPSALTFASLSACLRRIVGSFTVTAMGSATPLFRSGGHAAELLVIDELGDRRFLSAHGAVGVPADPHFLEVHVQCVVQQQPSLEGLALAR